MIGLIVAIITLSALMLFFIITSILLSIAYINSISAMQKIMNDYIDIYRKYANKY